MSRFRISIRVASTHRRCVRDVRRSGARQAGRRLGEHAARRDECHEQEQRGGVDNRKCARPLCLDRQIFFAEIVLGQPAGHASLH